MKLVQIISILLSITSGVFTLNKEWWKHASIYEIYLRSFKDSDGDGIGDIRGLISKLDYIVDIGVDTIYLPPFYPSSMADGGYDITDYRGIDPAYGTMEDFEELLREMKHRGLHLVTDLVINHSSNKHEWFEKSINRINPYTDYYVWVDAKGYDQNGNPIPPNNWFSIFNLGKSGTAWEWNENRKQFYLHQCMIEQPDFNLRNEAIKQEIKDMMKFWLDKGVAGFRVDAPMILLEDALLRDNPPMPPNANVFNLFQFFEHTMNHPDTYRFLNELNVFVEEYDRTSGKRIQTPLIGETYGEVKTVIKYFGTRRFPSFHLPLNFLVTTLATYMDARQLHDYLHTWLDKVPKNMASSWALGNHDQGRVSYRLNMEYNHIMLTLVTLLPGTCQLYYGEELNMGQNNLVQMKDRYNRVFHRTPMQWDDTKNAGFSTGDGTWLPVNPNYWHINVQAQTINQNSSLTHFKDLTSLRKTDTMKYGDLKFNILSKWVLAFSRTYQRTSYTIIINLGTETQLVDWPTDSNNFSNWTVVASSPNSGYKKGSKIKSTRDYPVTSVLRPQSVVVLGSTMNARIDH